MRTVPLLLTAVLLAGVTGCSDDAPVAAPATAGPTAPATSPSAPSTATSTPAATVVVRVGTAGPVRAEVADTEQEREVGLMSRTSVPPGTGMVFRWDVPTTGQFYMFHTLVPLTSVFALDGRVVGVYDMTPCTSQDPQACARYGPPGPFDTVLETAPATLRGVVAVGDPLTL